VSNTIPPIPEGVGDRVPSATREVSPQVVAEQIGRWNIAAISGGRIAPHVGYDPEVGTFYDGVTMKVGHGYRVVVTLAGNDLYTVRRIFSRGGKDFDKGTVTDVFCDDVGDVAYYASCYQNVPFPGEFQAAV